MTEQTTLIIEAADETSFAALIDEPGVTSVAFFDAPWCTACRNIERFLGRLKSGSLRDMRIVRVDVDVLPQVAQRHAVAALPFLVVFQNGNVMSTRLGDGSEEMLRDWLLSLIEADPPQKAN